MCFAVSICAPPATVLVGPPVAGFNISLKSASFLALESAGDGNPLANNTLLPIQRYQLPNNASKLLSPCSLASGENSLSLLLANASNSSCSQLKVGLNDVSKIGNDESEHFDVVNGSVAISDVGRNERAEGYKAVGCKSINSGFLQGCTPSVCGIAAPVSTTAISPSSPYLLLDNHAAPFEASLPTSPGRLSSPKFLIMPASILRFSLIMLRLTVS